MFRVKLRYFQFYLLLASLWPVTTQASFIESTIGTAVVNDATASYFNPAALVQLKNAQIIPQETFAYFHTHFSGQTTSVLSSITESGSSSTNTRYYSPSLYMAMPATDKVMLGLAIVTNSANRNPDDSSILRYVQAGNNIQDYDVVPVVAVKLNNVFSVGGGVNFSYAKFNLQPILGFPGSNIADSQSSNKSDGVGYGLNAGFLYKPTPLTIFGFNYRSITTYRLSGNSVYEGDPVVMSNHYHFVSRTPARSVFSVNHFLTPTFGLIGTIQRIQWSAITNTHVYGIATLVGTTPAIVNGTVPYYLRDTWLATLGTHHRLTPKWIVRVAGTYSQSASNPHYQIANGDSIVLGASTGYEIDKMITIDASYAHAFMKDQGINIAGSRFLINGVNQGARDSVSLKLTFNV